MRKVLLVIVAVYIGFAMLGHAVSSDPHRTARNDVQAVQEHRDHMNTIRELKTDLNTQLLRLERQR